MSRLHWQHRAKGPSRGTGRRFLVIAASAVCVLQSSRGHAQSSWSDKAGAAQLIEDGDKLKAAGSVLPACSKYDESYRRNPEIDTLLKLADCYEQAGKTASAWAAFKQALDGFARANASGTRDPREDTARARASALEPRVPKLTVTVIGADTPGLEVRQDGQVIGRAAWGSAVPTDPGSYQLTAGAPGKKGWKQVVEVGSNGANVDVAVPILENDAPASAVAAPGADTRFDPDRSRSPAPASGWSSQRTIGFVVGGVGVAALGVGAIYGLMSNSKVSERDAICPSGVHCTAEEAFRISDLTTLARTDAARCELALVVGAIAVAGGAALVLTAPKQSTDAATALRLAPWMGMTSGGVSMGGGW